MDVLEALYVGHLYAPVAQTFDRVSKTVKSAIRRM